MRKIILPLIVLFFLPLLGSAQIITTVAGTDTGSNTGDGGLAVQALIGEPLGVAADNYGNFYFSAQNRIRKVNSSGIISTIAGTSVGGFSGDGGSATNAQMFFPGGIAIDHIGNIYFADTRNNRIRKIDNLGVITTIAGNGDTVNNGDGGAATSAAIYHPGYFAFNPSGELFFTSLYSVRKINGAGIITTIAGTDVPAYSGDGGPATAAQMNASGLAIDATGNIYISDSYFAVVRKVNSAGIISTISGNLTSGFSGDGGTAVTANLFEPSGLSVDAIGNLFICDHANDRIRMIDTLGIITTVAGGGPCVSGIGDGGPATEGCLARPTDVKADNSGNLYIADGVNWRVRKVGGVAGVGEIAGDRSGVTVAPNPSQGEFTVKIRSSEDKVQIVVSDIVGHVILVGTYPANDEISLKLNCAPGVYFLSLTTSTEKWSRKIVIRP